MKHPRIPAKDFVAKFAVPLLKGWRRLYKDERWTWLASWQSDRRREGQIHAGGRARGKLKGRSKGRAACASA